MTNACSFFKLFLFLTIILLSSNSSHTADKINLGLSGSVGMEHSITGMLTLDPNIAVSVRHSLDIEFPYRRLVGLCVTTTGLLIIRDALKTSPQQSAYQNEEYNAEYEELDQQQLIDDLESQTSRVQTPNLTPEFSINGTSTSPLLKQKLPKKRQETSIHQSKWVVNSSLPRYKQSCTTRVKKVCCGLFFAVGGGFMALFPD